MAYPRPRRQPARGGSGAIHGQILPALDDNEARLVALWLHGRSPATQRAYAADLAALRAVIPSPLRQLTLGDLQDYQLDFGHFRSRVDPEVWL